jgi:uncharacterized protein (DUF983 family)
LRILENPTYIGQRHYRGQIYEAAWDPLVSRDQWEQVQARRAREYRQHAPTDQRYVLSGLISCEVCGRTLHHHHAGGKSPRYVCSSSSEGVDCSGGGVTEAYADKLVTEAYLTRAELLGSGVIGKSARDIDYRAQWQALSIRERNEILRTALQRLGVVARPSRTDARHYGRRALRLTWAPSWRVEPSESPMLLQEGRVNSKLCPRCGRRRDMTMFLRRELPDGWCSKCRKRYKPTGSPEGRTWTEWRNERLLFRPLRPSTIAKKT